MRAVPSFPLGSFGTDAVGPIFALYATGRDARSWRRPHGDAARRFRGAFFVTLSGKVRRGGGGEPTVFRNSPTVVYLCTSRVREKRVHFATPEFYIVFYLLTLAPLFFLLKLFFFMSYVRPSHSGRSNCPKADPQRLVLTDSRGNPNKEVHLPEIMI